MQPYDAALRSAAVVMLAVDDVWDRGTFWDHVKGVSLRTKCHAMGGQLWACLCVQG